jgi:hypothetical protein
MVRRLKAARMEIGERRGDRRRLRRRRKGTEMRELLDTSTMLVRCNEKGE